MIDRKTDSWKIGTTDAKHKSYFDDQLENPKQSTKAFYEFISRHVDIEQANICDAACGNGANLFYVQRQFNPAKLFGFDFIEEHIESGNNYISSKGLENIELVPGDIYSPPAYQNLDGITCIQTLSWLDGYEQALHALSELDAQWIAASSLFYEGLIEAQIEIKHFDDDMTINHQTPYNIYSLNRFQKVARDLGYTQFFYEKFEIDIDLAPGNPDKMGTYTTLTDQGERLQRSGPLLMPWYFVLMKK